MHIKGIKNLLKACQDLNIVALEGRENSGKSFLVKQFKQSSEATFGKWTGYSTWRDRRTKSPFFVESLGLDLSNQGPAVLDFLSQIFDPDYQLGVDNSHLRFVLDRSPVSTLAYHIWNQEKQRARLDRSTRHGDLPDPQPFEGRSFQERLLILRARVEYQAQVFMASSGVVVYVRHIPRDSPLKLDLMDKAFDRAIETFESYKGRVIRYDNEF